MEEKDLVLIKDKEGNIMSGGYKIPNKLFNKQIGIQYGGSNNKEIEKVSDMFKNYVIPTGLLLMDNNYNINNKTYSTTYEDTIDDDLYERMLRLTDINSTVFGKTKKSKKQQKRRYTKKNNKI